MALPRATLSNGSGGRGRCTRYRREKARIEKQNNLQLSGIYRRGWAYSYFKPLAICFYLIFKNSQALLPIEFFKNFWHSILVQK
jgi:hypothetical protein